MAEALFKTLIAETDHAALLREEPGAPARQAAISALTARLSGALGPDPSLDALLAVWSAVHHVADAAVAASDPGGAGGAAFACRAGCAFCCRQPVSAVPWEVFALGSAATAEAPRGACPLLAGERCTVYARRPLICRMTVSLSAASCEAALAEGGPGRAVQPNALLAYRYALFEAAAALCRLRGWDLAWLRLDLALAALRAAQDAPGAWLSGAPLGEWLPDDQARTPLGADTAARADAIAAQLRSI